MCNVCMKKVVATGVASQSTATSVIRSFSKNQWKKGANFLPIHCFLGHKYLNPAGLPK